MCLSGEFEVKTKERVRAPCKERERERERRRGMGNEKSEEVRQVLVQVEKWGQSF